MDAGPASGNGVLLEGTLATALVYTEVHSANNFVTPASSGVPGGTSGPSSALNNLAPADFAYSASTAYGTVSNGGPVVGVFNAGGTSVSFGPNNPNGAGNLNLFRMKNPG